MELKKIKKAVALIELLIALTLTALLMMMLFGIVLKKTHMAINVSQSGVFYCWKDWKGELYQKTPKGNIQQISNCKIKIPEDAKNIQTYIIGGGAGGYKFSNTIGIDYTNSENNTPCIETNNDDLYTKLIYVSSEGEIIELDMNSLCDFSRSNDITCFIDSKLANAEFKEFPGSYFTKEFTKDMAKNGYCYNPVFINGTQKYTKGGFDSDHALYYYKGTDKTEDVITCTRRDSIGDTYTGRCYKNGYFISKSGNIEKKYTPVAISSSDINNIKYKLVSSISDISDFKKSLPGEMVMGNAEAGKEYTIYPEDIGDGGNAGNPGTETKFGKLSAKGGDFSRTGISINLNADIKINSIEEIERPEYIQMCLPSNNDCNGSINEALLNLPSKLGIKINGETEIKTAEFDRVSKNWIDDYNPQKTIDTIKKTGFGLFGASAAATNCNIKYYPIKEIQYNSFSKTTNSAKLDTCNSDNHGMGGAIIIKWD